MRDAVYLIGGGKARAHRLEFIPLDTIRLFLLQDYLQDFFPGFLTIHTQSDKRQPVSELPCKLIALRNGFHTRPAAHTPEIQKDVLAGKLGQMMHIAVRVIKVAVHEIVTYPDNLPRTQGRGDHLSLPCLQIFRSKSGIKLVDQSRICLAVAAT